MLDELHEAIIFSKIDLKNEHFGHLRQVLIILKDNHLYANFEKYNFCEDQVSSLGFIVGKERVHDDLKKIKAIQD
uniref:Uncharacterized protein n=1 Tax=Cajanus cajan TaxID=3821 RepID=A0A151SFB2_CAJCA|nr:hypothetical protein KK1_024562 [Cajanus cajan]